MFIGYQNGIARYIKNTKEEFNSIPHVSFDKIEEVEFAEMFNGVVYTSKEELLQVKTKAVEETRASLYAAQVDPITAHINRLRDEELTPEVAAEIERLKTERAEIVAKIKEENPYPVVEEPAETEATVEDLSEESNNEVVELYSMEI